MHEILNYKSFSSNINKNLFNKMQNKSMDAKHTKYVKYYKKNDTFWGLGIENELYLEFDKPVTIDDKFFLTRHRRERYSVDYYTNYKTENIKKMFEKIIKHVKDNDNDNDNDKDSSVIKLPLILNANSFIKTDCNNNSKTMYTKLCEPNTKFNGNTLFQDLLSDAYFIFTHNKEWLFDGDTIEFTTMNFYNNKLNNIINELDDFKSNFISKLSSYQKKNKLFEEYGNIQFMSGNHPFAIHMTNLNNIAIFNNGTLHYNITLPTKLDKYDNIKDFKYFYDIHKSAIKIIQWFEPFLISVYNTPDIFSELNNDGDEGLSVCFSKCSQRCAVSRYIGIGTYDTDLMKIGKILSVHVNDFDKCENWWYKRFHETSGYNPLNDVGLDINFNKYKNHGIELRFFDHITDLTMIKESFEFIIYLMDEIIESKRNILNPIYNNNWNNIVYNCMIYGKEYSLTPEEKMIYNKILNIDIENDNIHDIYYEIFNKLKERHINAYFSDLCLIKEKKNPDKIKKKYNKCFCQIS